MRVKLLISRAGKDLTQNAGEQITVDDSEGLRMIQAGQALLIEEIEKASTKKVTEKATKKKGKK
tara:strand:- start:310 stop:501 length:192 start_codon:yes stop_codon:yes gene_type:complete